MLTFQSIITITTSRKALSVCSLSISGYTQDLMNASILLTFNWWKCTAMVRPPTMTLVYTNVSRALKTTCAPPSKHTAAQKHSMCTLYEHTPVWTPYVSPDMHTCWSLNLITPFKHAQYAHTLKAQKCGTCVGHQMCSVMSPILAKSLRLIHVHDQLSTLIVQPPLTQCFVLGNAYKLYTCLHTQYPLTHAHLPCTCLHTSLHAAVFISCTGSHSDLNLWSPNMMK